MTIIDVSASRNYQVKIGSGLLSLVAKEIHAVCNAKSVCIVSDTNVTPLYVGRLTDQLKQLGFSCFPFVFPAGEESKCGTTYLQLLNFLAENRISRTDCLIALGGGVVGDLTGFAAATYLRGIPYIQIPTTLLAAVDSSVGGKTAIDLEAGKNLAGAFYQPSAVICDTDTLNTLPQEVFRDGCAEVIKYGILYDEILFSHLEDKGLDFDREAVIARCVELKRNVVAEDEFDTGARQKLNLGHTIGHGVEANSCFSVSHGKAVAIGTAIVTRSAAVQGICGTACRDRILNVLAKFGLPVNTAYTSEMLFRRTLSDKKRSGGTVNLIIPEKIGFCRISPTPLDKIQSFIEAGL